MTVNNSRLGDSRAVTRIQSRVSPVENIRNLQPVPHRDNQEGLKPPQSGQVLRRQPEQGYREIPRAHCLPAYLRPFLRSGPPPRSPHPGTTRSPGTKGLAAAAPQPRRAGQGGRAPVLTASAGQGSPSKPRCSARVPGSTARSGRAGSGPRCRRRLTGPQLRHSPRAHSRPPLRDASAPP